MMTLSLNQGTGSWKCAPLVLAGLGALLIAGGIGSARGQSDTFGANAQHTSFYNDVPAQRLNVIHWTTLIDATFYSGGSHYGAPLITASNTVLVPITTSTTIFQVRAFEGATGRPKYTLTNDYRLPFYSYWAPVYQPVLAHPPS